MIKKDKMPETRIVETVYGVGGYDPTKPNNNIIGQVTAEISDEQLAEEAERDAMAKADQLIDAITNLAEAKVFLKRLCARLIRNNVLP